MTKAIAARALMVFGLAAIPLGASAQKKPSDYTVEDFFRLAEYTGMQLSPSAKRLSALAPIKGRNNLVIIDMATRKPHVITAFEKVDVFNVFWVNDERLCLRVADFQEVTGRFNYRGTYCINHDGTDLRDFTRLGVRDASTTLGGYTFLDFLARTDDGSPDIYVGARLRTRDSQDIYRFNTSTGRYQLLTAEAPPTGYVTRWVLDRNFEPRIAVSQPKRDNRNALLRRFVWYRDSANAKWEQLFSTELDGEDGSDAFSPLAFDYDNTTLYVSARAGKDKSAIYKYDTKTRQMGEMMFGHTLVDVNGGLRFSRVRKTLLGIQFEADKPVKVWVDPATDRLQRQVDATFPKTVNELIVPDQSDDWALIFSHSDVDPGAYYLMNRKKPGIELVAKTRPWLDPALMSERKFILYEARDGRQIPAWVTIPRGSSGKNLPLIVHIHGGPWVRGYSWINWGRWPDAQFFASRGYAVLEPEPRGSTGFGRDHYISSFKQWGQAMQDDITDGALYLAKEGIVDKNRMCVKGGSYGGYASAMALAKDPDLWRCGVPYVAVTDLFLFQNVVYSDIAMFTDFFQTDFKRRVGDSDADKEMFTRYSPNLQAAKVKAPVLLAMGSDDFRVPQVHGDKYAANLEAAGKKVEYVIYPGEGHGFNRADNVYDFYRRVEKFFAENLK